MNDCNLGMWNLVQFDHKHTCTILQVSDYKQCDNSKLWCYMGHTLYIENLYFSNNFLSETAITVLMDMLY